MSSFISKVASIGIKDIAEGAGSLLNSIRSAITGKEPVTNELLEKMQSMAENVYSMTLQASVKTDELRTNVIIAEARGGSWLQRNWRPLTMVTFVILIVLRWLGATVAIDKGIEMQLMEIIKIGLGGYVVGRSVEKGIKEWKKTTNE